MAVALAPVSTTDLDGNRTYTHPVTGDELVSVTTVLGATLGKPFLTAWAARLAAEYAVDNLDLLMATVVTKGAKAAVDLAKDKAKEVRERKADAGKYVHKVVEALILWASPEGEGADIALPDLPEHLEHVLYDEQPLDEVVDWMITGFTSFVTTWNPEFLASEMATYNLGLGVAGTLDAIIALSGVALKPDGTLVAAPGKKLVVCVDVKTGKSLDATVPEQLAAYRRMTEALPVLTEGLVPMPDTDAAAVLHLRPEHRDGYRLMPLSPAADAQAWNRFRRAVDLYMGRAEVGSKPGKVVYPPRPDGTMPSPFLADLDGEGYGRAPGALTKAGLDSLDDLASMTGEELLAAKGVGPKTVDIARRMLADHNLSLAGEEAPAGKVA